MTTRIVVVDRPEIDGQAAANISEGHCPAGWRLELRDEVPDCGWCNGCMCGWSFVDGVVRQHFHPKWPMLVVLERMEDFCVGGIPPLSPRGFL
jgi:hypothetical protein